MVRPSPPTLTRAKSDPGSSSQNKPVISPVVGKTPSVLCGVIFIVSIVAFGTNALTLDHLSVIKHDNVKLFTCVKIITDVIGCIIVSYTVKKSSCKSTPQPSFSVKELVLLTCGLIVPLLLDSISLFGYVSYPTYVVVKSCKTLVAFVVKLYNQQEVKNWVKIEAVCISFGALMFFVGMPQKVSTDTWKSYVGSIFLIISLVISGITNQRIGSHLKKPGGSSAALLLKLSILQLGVLVFIMCGIVAHVYLIYEMNTQSTLMFLQVTLPTWGTQNFKYLRLFILSATASAIVRQCAMETTRIFDTVVTAMFGTMRKCGIIAYIHFTHGNNFTTYQSAAMILFVVPGIARLIQVGQTQLVRSKKKTLLPM